MSETAQFFEDLSRTHSQTVSAPATVLGRAHEPIWPKVDGITRPIEEFGVLRVSIPHPTASTIAAVATGLERLVADALAGYAIQDPRWKAQENLLLGWTRLLPYTQNVPPRPTLAGLFRAHIDVVLVEASMQSPFTFVAKIYASRAVQRWMKEWQVKPLILSTIVHMMIAAGPQTVPAEPEPLPPPAQEAVCDVVEVLRVTKEVENSLQANSEVVIEAPDCRVTIRKGPPPSTERRR